MLQPETVRPSRLLYGLSLALALLLLTGGLNLPLFDLDEGAFSEASREMLVHGDFLFITLDGEPRPDKPVLIYWLQALSVSLFGQQEWAWRLPSVLAAFFWLLAVWRFARERMPEELALQAALLTLTTAGVGIISHAATADALFNLWLSLTAFDMARYFEKRKTVHARKVWLWMGLGFLTKGPAALALPVLPALWHAWREKQWQALWRAITLPTGWLLFLLTALPWYVLVWLQHGPELLVQFFLDHNLGRFTRTMEGHGGHWWYYLLALPLVLLPYSGLLAEMAARYRGLTEQGWARFALRWLAVSFILFSLSGTQLPHYILYGLPLLYPLLATLGQMPAAQWRFRRLALLTALIPPLLWLGISVASPGLIAQLKSDSYEAWLFSAAPQLLFQQWPWALLLLLLTTGLLYSLRQKPTLALVGAGALHLLFLQQVMLPVIASLQQAPVKQAAFIARAAGAPVVAWRIYMPSFSVYRQAVTPHRLPLAGEWVFTRKDRLPSLREKTRPTRWKTVYDQGAIVLLKPETDTP